MKNILRLSVLLLPLLLLAPTRAAFNPAIVAADAQWVVYADVNTLRASTLGKELIDTVTKMQSDATEGKIGIDIPRLLTTVGTLTAYGTNFAPDPKLIDGALVFQGTADLRKIALALVVQATVTTPDKVVELKDLPFEAYEIDRQVIVAFPPEPIVIVSKAKTQVVKARDVFRGTAPSLASKAGSPLNGLLANSNDAYLFAASVVPTGQLPVGDGPQTRILQMAKSGSITLGEKGPQTFVHAQLMPRTGEMADKLTKILQGTVAAVSLIQTNDKDLAEFLNSANVQTVNNTVVLDLAYSSARIVQMIQILHQPPAPPAAVRQVPPAPISHTVAAWNSTESTVPDSASANALASRTIENIELKNGATVTLGWKFNGGRGVTFNRIEIAPAQGGAPLVYRSDMMRMSGNRGNFTGQFQFPGADGVYTLKVAYTNDPEGKASYTVSVRDPRPSDDASAK